MTSTTTTTRWEATPTPTPLYVQPLRHYRDDDEKDNGYNNTNHPHQTQQSDTEWDGGGGRYETVYTLISPSPLHDNVGDIETSLQQFVQEDGSVLWRRVVIKSGPSTATTTATTKTTTKTTLPNVHASFLLPDDYYHHHINNHGGSATVATTNSNNNNNMLCWASFVTTKDDSLDHQFLCVLAHPTLLCIWDVYPQQKQKQRQCSSNAKKDGSKCTSAGTSVISGEGHYVPLPFEACGIFPLQAGANTKRGGLLIQRCETVEDLWAFDTITSQKHQPGRFGDEDDDENDNDDKFVLQAPPRPVRVGRQSNGETLTNLPTLTDAGIANANNTYNNSVVVVTQGNNNNNNMVPSLFSLSNPKGDILPVSTPQSEHDTSMMGPVTDVFEKILFVGTMKWIDDNTGIDWWSRREHSQSIAVTYHNQLKR
jgi:hypothetical protein